ncbi:hypothetical protein DVH24_002740 [Malus domestica]|uniref:U1 small nuclear ribonucleoprotein C n=2 Tax=Malus domestica TaxID=3750 RepID=A0A498KB22_MALDO|nr:hypothetical protein DVH24_002740 [Malus domestica]
MPRYYCDYCDTYLTHDSPSVRKQHNAGYKHKANVREYYQQFEQEQTQSLIDQRIKEHLGNSAAYGGQPYGQIGAAYNQHLMAQPRLPGMPQMLPGIRPPVLPRPPILNAPGYSSAPHMFPMMAPPGAPGMPGQLSAPMRPPPALNPPPAVPGSTAPNASNGPPPMAAPPMYQPNPTAPTSGGYESFNPNTQPPDSSQQSIVTRKMTHVAAPSSEKSSAITWSNGAFIM